MRRPGLPMTRAISPLEVEAVRLPWPHHLAEMPHLGGGEAHEDGGVVLAAAPSLFLVLAVVEADAEDLVGVRDGGQVGDFVEGDIRRISRRCRHALQALGDGRLQRGDAGSLPHIHHAAVRHAPERRPSVPLKRQPAHESSHPGQHKGRCRNRTPPGISQSNMITLRATSPLSRARRASVTSARPMRLEIMSSRCSLPCR